MDSLKNKNKKLWGGGGRTQMCMSLNTNTVRKLISENKGVLFSFLAFQLKQTSNANGREVTLSTINGWSFVKQLGNDFKI